MSDAPDEVKPKFLGEEAMHRRYSVDSAMEHYKNRVYPGQRGDWLHGRVNNAYRSGYDRIDWKK